MRILIVGNGGREYAIAKALKRSPDLELYNFGDFLNPGLNDLCEDFDNDDLVKFALQKNIDFAVIGPEAYLERGIVDCLENVGISSIGPHRILAKLETSKIFTRFKLHEWNLDKYNVKFESFLPRLKHSIRIPETIFDSFNNNFVIKEDGLRGGKGVKVSGEHFENNLEVHKHCADLFEKKTDFIIEEKLVGQEFSLMSFCDGTTLKSMPVVQDFKRAFNNDKGPNTGGMGSISYPNHRLDFLTEEDIAEAHHVNECVIENIQSEVEELYVGILYGSFMKLPSGEIKVIEYNCRFGDPECINVLSLLKTDLLDIFIAMFDGTLNKINIEYESAYTVCRYIVPEGYPTSPQKNVEITLENETNIAYDSIIFASVEEENDSLLLRGSRAIAIIEKGYTLNEAYKKVDREIKKIKGPVFSRTDIGKPGLTYADTGVDIDKGNQVVNNIQKYIKSTSNENTFDNYGDFGGLYKFGGEVLVSSTDGVGTKSIMAEKLLGDEGFYNLGKDIVNHCVNDILVKGARPLFFLDYFASSKLKINQVELFVKGASEACKEVNCVLIGGETAEMPGVYKDDRSDLVGTIVGSVKENNMIDGKKNIRSGDVLIGLRSDGPHTNGFSFLRALYSEELIDDEFAKSLLEPHRCYYKDVQKIINSKIDICALCHITGGGLVDNPERVLSNNKTISWANFEISDMFKKIREVSGVDEMELRRTFNCGIGMIVFVPSEQKEKLLGLFDNNYAVYLGEVV